MHPEIVRLLFIILSASDQICFALSCKFTLAYYLGLRKVQGMTMPVTPQRITWALRCSHGLE